MNRLFLWLAIVLILVVFAWSAGHESTGRESYYRGVRETCLQSYAVDGSYTTFDVQVCREFEQRARDARWYERQLVK